VNVPGAVEVGATIVWAGAPTVPETFEKFDSVGVDGSAPVTAIPKFSPAQVPETADHAPPLLLDASDVNVGVGLTFVVGAAALHFQPIVPEPLITTKY